MSSRLARSIVALCAVLVAACGFDADPAVAVRSAPVGSLLLLELDEPDALGDDAEVRWRLERAPEGSARVLLADPTRAELRVDRAGEYVIDRWVTIGASDAWTHRFFVDGIAQPPVARIDGSLAVAVGDEIVLDGSQSSDPSGAPLTFVWSLTSRPLDSVAALDATDAVTARFTADRPGSYRVELDVFNGTSWSVRTAIAVVVAQ